MTAVSIADEVVAERARQDEKWGEQNHPDVDPVLMNRPGGVTAERMAEHYEIPTEARAKFKCQYAPKDGGDTWAHILIEEVAETVAAATEGSRQDLRTELVQVAAVAQQWIAAIDRRVEL